MDIFNSEYANDAPLRVSYHNGNHYNAVIDPENPTVGLGLGLPELNTGSSDPSQVEKALEMSEMEQIEKVIHFFPHISLLKHTIYFNILLGND